MLNTLTVSRLAAIQDNVIAVDPLTMKRFDAIRASSTPTQVAAVERLTRDCDRESWTLASPFCNPDF